MSKASNKVVATIGHLRKQDGVYRVRCAGCGSGKETPDMLDPLSRAIDGLEAMGWSNRPDGLWRCERCAAKVARYPTY